MWPIFFADALARGIQDTTKGMVEGAKEGQLAQQREEQMIQARQEAAQKAQLFPHQLRAAKTAADLGEQKLPYDIRGAKADVELAEGTLQPKIDVARMGPDQARWALAETVAKIDQLKAATAGHNIENTWAGKRVQAQIDHLRAQEAQLKEIVTTSQTTRTKQTEAAGKMADFMNRGGLKTGSLKDLMNNPEFLGLMGQYGPWLKDNPLVDAYIQMLRSTGQENAGNALMNQLRIEDQALQLGKTYESRFFPPVAAGAAPTDPDARQWVSAHARAQVYRMFGASSPVPPPSDSMREKLKQLYSSMAGPDNRSWWQFWGKPEVSEQFLNTTIKYLQAGYSYEEAAQAAAKDLLVPKTQAPATSAAPAPGGGSVGAKGFSVRIEPDGTRTIVPNQ